MAEDSEFLEHGPCPNPDCGSPDAYSLYSDGHGWCFSCETYFPGEGDRKPAAKAMSSKLIDPGDARALIKRGITQETCEKFGYTVADFNGKHVQVAPYFSTTGEQVAQHVRFPNKEFAWFGSQKGVALFGQHLWRDGGKMVVITEGEIDCLSVSQLQGNKWPVVSIPSGAQSAAKAIKNNLEWLERFESVVFMFDMDDPGRDAAQKCALLLTPGKAKVAHLPLKDPNEMLQQGRGKEVIDAVWGAKSYRPDGIINGADLRSSIKTQPVKGLAIPYLGLMDKTWGIRKSELWLFTAGSGIGKSTLVHELGYILNMEHKQSLGILALEESPTRTGQRYVGIHLNKPIHLSHEGVTDEEIDAAFDETLGNERIWLYEHFGSTDLDNLIAKIRYMVVGLGCDFIILDHISIVVSGLDEISESERKMIDKLMTRLRSLIAETGCGMLAVVHLKRPDKGKSYNEGRTVSLTDLRGSGSLEQLSDVVIAAERNQQDAETSDIATLRVLKCRPIGLTGEAGYVKYNYDTGRLLPLEDNPFKEIDRDGPGEGADF